MTERTCTFPGCDGLFKARGWCNAHYWQWFKWGDPAGLPAKPNLPGERWLPVVDYEGLYEVSDLGRVRSLHLRTAGLILKPDKRPDQHLKVCLYKGKRKRRRYVHVLVMRAFVGPCPEGLETRHLDGDATSNRLGNLVYGTKSENAQDRTKHGRDRWALQRHRAQGA